MIFKNDPQVGNNRAYAIRKIREALKAFRNDTLKAIDFIGFHIPIEIAVKIKDKPIVYQTAGFLSEFHFRINKAIKKENSNKNKTMYYYKKVLAADEIKARFKKFTF